VSRYLSVLLLGLAAACGSSRDLSVQVQVTGPDSQLTPVADLPVVVLPYDRDSIIAAMEAAAEYPRPHEAELDSLFRAFREVFIPFARVNLRERQLRDTLSALNARLDTLPRNSEEYREIYSAVTALHDSLPPIAERLHALTDSLDRVRRRANPRIDSLRREVDRWEDITFRGYEQATEATAKRTGLTPEQQTTGPRGWATFSLKGGPWWIYVRAWDASDPNAEWYWNVPVSGDTVRLTPENGVRRPRY
jgi:hypothetical protein